MTHRLAALIGVVMTATAAAQQLGPPHTKRPALVLSGHTKAVHTVAFSPDGKRLATASSDRNVKIWNPSTGALIRTLPDAGGSGIAFSPDGSRLVTGSASGALAQWSTQQWAPLSYVAVHPNGSLSVAYARPARRMPMGAGLKKPTPDLVLAATLTPGKARLFDATNATSATLLHELDCCSASNDPNENYTVSILRVRFSPNGLKVGTALDHGVILWDVASGASQPVLSFTHPRDFAFSPDGSLVVIVGPAGSFNSGVLVKNLATSDYYAAAVPSYGGYDAVAFSPDGTLLALATGSGGPCSPQCTPRIVLMRIPGNQVQRELLGHSKAIATLAFSPDGSLLASGSSDNTARLWAIC